MRICLVTPAGARSSYGNLATAERWATFLRQLGHGVMVQEVWDGERPDMMIALHARRSCSSIARYTAAHLERPLMGILTGTDLYRDIRFDEGAQRSLDLATHLVVLQDAGQAELEPRYCAKTRVIYQSTDPSPPPTKRHFDICVVGNLRTEKDPFRAAVAARLLPGASHIRPTHAGRAQSVEFAEEARTHMEKDARYRWIGELPRWRVRKLLSHTRLLVQSSFMEGGANTLSEALAAGVPVIASDIPGNVGMLGEDYPGYYPVGDEKALAHALERIEADAAFRQLLEARCASTS
jgi:putative glycosyltransferase (TIGR04348 family)